MNKLSLLLLLASFSTIQAQEIKEIFIDQNGIKSIVNLVLNDVSISIDTKGNLLQMNLHSGDKGLLNNNTNAIFQNDAEIDYRDPKSSYSKDDNLEYYDNFYDYSSGKLKTVNKFNFDYYDGFYSYQKGNLKSIGDVKFTYYDQFNSHEEGKIKSIGNVTFTYHDNFYPYKSGKLKSIKGNKNNIKINVFND